MTGPRITAPEWKRVCRVDDIVPLGSRRIARPGRTDVAVFRNAKGQVFALLDRCPHRGGPLSQGIVFGDSVACPLHNWTIGLDDGCAKAPDAGCTPRFAVRLVDGEVFLDLAELRTIAIDPPTTDRRAPLGAGTASAERPIA